MTISRDSAGLRLANVTKTYGTSRVLDKVTFSCKPGTITGLLGPNGSGKTTAMRAMLGLARADQGEVLFDGVPYLQLARPGQVVGAMLDPAARHPGRTVNDTLAIAAITVDTPRQRAFDAIDALGLGSVGRRRFGALSLGMRQRVALAIALLGRPRFLILDEPMNGLDIETSAWVRETLVSHARETGGVVLLSTHLLEELQSFADGMVVLSKGAVTYAGAVRSHQQMRTSVLPVDAAELSAALDRRGVPYRVDAPAGVFKVEATPRAVGRIVIEERVLVDHLVGESESIREAYKRVTVGEFSTRGQL